MCHIQFNVDTFRIGVDNCSTTRSPNDDPFKDLKLKHIRKCIGTGTGLTIASKGTFIINLENVKNRIHEIEIPNSLCIPGIWIVLLSPENSAQ